MIKKIFAINLALLLLILWNAIDIRRIRKSLNTTSVNGSERMSENMLEEIKSALTIIAGLMLGFVLGATYG